uniref:Sigma C n=1 Tax=Pacific black duck orthoreovirus TaxID=2798289 RepID=A0A7T4S0C9_9REOV|nr:sigma C [Pacific black duck orthoreovirus]
MMASPAYQSMPPKSPDYPMTRSQVIALLTSLLPCQSSDVDWIKSEIATIKSMITTLTTTQLSLAQRVNGLTDRLHDMDVQLSSLSSGLSGVRARVADLELQLPDVSKIAADAYEYAQTLEPRIVALESSLSALTTTVNNHTSTLSQQALTLVSLDQRVTALEGGPGSGLNAKPPLSISDGALSLGLSPTFASVAGASLTGPSSPAHFIVGDCLGSVAVGQSTSTTFFNFRYHAYGQRTMFLFSSRGPVTVNVGDTAYVIIDLTRVTSQDYDLNEMTPSGSFSQSSFMVDIAYRDGDTREISAVHTTGRFESPNYRISWVRVSDRPKNYEIMALRFTIANST